jgi:hypothetical protein
MNRCSGIIAIVGLVFLSQSASALPAKKLPAAPKSLLIYYGYPSLINGAYGKLTSATAEFAKYDFVILGGGLQDSKHDDHGNTKAIIASTKGTEFFGYIPLGNRLKSDPCLPLKAIEDQLKAWAAMGVKGVLFDEFGFDYGVSRARQNDSVTAAHQAKLRVIANAWKPDDVFLRDESRVKPALDKNDIYLWESFRYREGKLESAANWRAKADRVAAGREALPLSVFSVSTNKVQPKEPSEPFAHQWYCAAIDGHAATGWGYPNFAADAKAPVVPAPKMSLGELDGVPDVKKSITTVRTTTGVIEVDTDKGTGRFVPKK